MKMKNTTMKQKKFNKRKKLLDNNLDNPFDKDIDNELMDDHYDSKDDTDVELEINDDDVDLVEEGNLETENETLPVEIIEELIENVVIDDDKPKKRGRKAADKTKFYVEPKKFDEEIMKYYDSGKMSNELAEMVSKISHKLSYAPNFINYSYREEMVGDGVIRMMKALIAQKYNREKGTNPFSYFTRIAFNAFRNRIKKEKHMHETHEKYQREIMFMSEQFNNMSKNNNISIMKERDRDY
jgi:hypothetical protein